MLRVKTIRSTEDEYKTNCPGIPRTFGKKT